MEETLKALVITEDLESRKILCCVIQQRGIEVTECKMLAEAPLKISEVKPDLIFVDVNLLTTASVKFIQEVHQQNGDVLIAVMADRHQDQIIIDCFKAGASDFLRKPIAGDDVEKLVSRFVSVVTRRKNRLFQSNFLNSAQLRLELPSQPRSVAPAVRYIVDLIAGLFDSREVMRLELALFEVIQNALEHGNLGITYDEKVKLCEQEKLEAEVGERSKIALEQGKITTIQVAVTPSEFTCIVEDSGSGFDWRKLLKGKSKPEVLTNLNGRGMVLVVRIFDTVEFNELGNRIMLIKKIVKS